MSGPRELRRAVLAATLATGLGTGLAAGLAAAAGGGAGDPLPGEARALGAIQQFGATLKGALLGAIDEGGPVAAIDVCSDMAPEIAAAVAEETGVTVARTALRVRNPSNAPDARDEADLAAIQAALDAGTPPDAIIVRHAATDATPARIAKPIMTQGLCLACHGKELAPDVQAAIDARYPEDEATGFDDGSLRGAFVATWR